MGLAEEIDKYDIPRHVKNYVESELKLYETYMVAIQRLQQDYLDVRNQSRQPSIVPGGSGDPDKVSLTVIRMLNIEQKICDKTRKVQTIQKGLSILSEEERELVSARYFKCPEYSDEFLMNELHYGWRNKYFAVKKQALYKFAVIMNLI